MVSRRVVIVSFLVAAATTVAVAQRGTGPGIVGVWRVAEVRATGPDARTITAPQPGLIIFTQRHYSMSIVTSDAVRPDLPAQATDKQVADAFGPFTGQAGTYEVKGNELTTRPIVAKNPGTMRAGNFAVGTFVLAGNSLTVTTKANAAGPVANPTTTKYTRVE